MNLKIKIWAVNVIGLVTSILLLTLPREVLSADFMVYSVYKGIEMGSPNEIPRRDYYVNMGSQQGVREGSILDVFRRTSTYDVQSQKLFKDVTFPIAKLKVIHVESGAAIARLDKMLPLDKTPIAIPQSVIAGDIVQIGH